MQLRDLDFSTYQQHLQDSQLVLDMGVYKFNIQSSHAAVLRNIYAMYADYPLVEGGNDFNVRIAPPANLRRWYRPQIQFYADQIMPFLPLPKTQAYPLLEWGMNWCVNSAENTYLIIHAGVVARNNKAIILPAPPGSGKSTLTAYLAYSGWRLLSDEMALITPRSTTVSPFVRPVCLKNNAIDLVHSWFPDVVHTPAVSDTSKGDVAHFQPPSASVDQYRQDATVHGIVFPRYQQGQSLNIYPLSVADVFQRLAENSFNYNVLGEHGFHTLISLAEQSRCFDIEYSDVAEVEAFLLEECL